MVRGIVGEGDKKIWEELMENNQQLTTSALHLPIPADRFEAASKLHGQLHRWRLLLRKHWWVLVLVLSVPAPVWWLSFNAPPE
jgi:hypothetical protein